MCMCACVQTRADLGALVGLEGQGRQEYPASPGCRLCLGWESAPRENGLERRKKEEKVVYAS